MEPKTKTALIWAALLTVCTLTAAGCDADASSDDAAAPADNTEPDGNSEEPDGGDCDDVVWTYSNVGQPFVATWCTSCHHSELPGDQRPAGTEGVNLEDYDQVVTFLERIELRALSENPSMPPAGGPTEEEIFRVQEWVACGAPE